MTVNIDLISSALAQQVALLGSDGCVQYSNPAFETFHTQTERSTIGRQIHEIIGNELYARLAPYLSEAFRGLKIELPPFPLPSNQNLEWSVKLIPTPTGECLMIAELNPVKQTYFSRVDHFDERLRTFVDFAPIGMVFSHADGRIFEANRAFLNLVGYSREELDRGEVQWDKITPPEYLHLDYEAIAEAKKLGFSQTYEKEYFSRSGERIPILLGFILFGAKRDEAVAFVVDLTAQKRAEEEVRMLNAELEARVATRTVELELANRELEAFCYSVSHDLRAPLRSIDGFAYALFQDYGEKLDSEALDFLSRIRASAKKMDGLISALLSLSRLSQAELAKEWVDVSALAEISAHESELHYPDRSIRFLVPQHLRVQADRRMLRVIFDNLFDNALKFTAKQSETVIQVQYDEPSGVFSIRDNGVGFDMSQSQKLFQPFERLHSPREFPGSGIGLATVHRIVRKHGGKIWATASVDKGAAFHFTLSAPAITGA